MTFSFRITYNRKKRKEMLNPVKQSWKCTVLNTETSMHYTFYSAFFLVFLYGLVTRWATFKMFFFDIYNSFTVLVLIYQHPFIKVTRCHFNSSPTCFPSNLLILLFLFCFLSFCVAIEQQHFIKRLKYTLDYIDNGEFTVLKMRSKST